MPKSIPDEKRISSAKDLSFENKAGCPQGPDFSICVLLKILQAVGSLVAKATGEFKRKAAIRMAHRMIKYGLKRLDILPLLLMNSILDNSNPHAS
jgi:hypothetical protein